MAKKRATRDSFDYDVCLSFAGENRTYVEQVAAALLARGVRVFYDAYEQVDLWGKDLYVHLADVYQNRARYCVLFASRQYAKKVWTSHERQNAQARAIREAKEYILPARLDSTAIPGVAGTVGFIDLRGTSATDLANMIVTKIGRRHREMFLPREPDRLYRRMQAKARGHREVVFQIAEDFVDALKLMTDAERALLVSLIYHGCPAGPPDNVHINLDRLRRLTKLPIERITDTLAGLRSLGFEFRVGSPHPESDEDSGDAAIVEYDVNSDFEPPASRPDLTQVSVIDAMVRASGEYYCEDCRLELVRAGDFSHLSTLSFDPDRHVGSGAQDAEHQDARRGDKVRSTARKAKPKPKPA